MVREANMARFRVSGELAISVTVEVEAGSAEEAIEKAGLLPVASLCNQCQTGEPGEWVPGGGLDGEPLNLRAEAV